VFNVGDKVKIIHCYPPYNKEYHTRYLNKVGTVISVGSGYVIVEFPDGDSRVYYFEEIKKAGLWRQKVK